MSTSIESGVTNRPKFGDILSQIFFRMLISHLQKRTRKKGRPRDRAIFRENFYTRLAKDKENSANRDEEGEKRREIRTKVRKSVS